MLFLFGGLVACLWCGILRQRRRPIAFGFYERPVGTATLDASSGTGIVVGNLGSSGQDGVSLSAASGGDRPTESLTVSFTPSSSSGTFNPGSYMNWTLMGSADGGSNQVIATQTTTYGSGINAQIAADLSPLAGGEKPNETITYYNTTTQPPTPVYTETVPSAAIDGVQNDSETGIVASVGFGFNSGQLILSTTFDDSAGTFQMASGETIPNVGHDRILATSQRVRCSVF